MSSSSPVPSAHDSQTVFSEVTNQTIMGVITGIRAQLDSVSRRQDELVDCVTDLRSELGTRTESAVSGPLTAAQRFPEQHPYIIPKVESVETNSVLSSGQGTEPTAVLRTNTRTRQTLDPKRRIRRHNAFYHISNAEEPPWTAPGGYHPYRDGGHPSPDRPASKRPAHPPFRSAETQGARAIPPPAATATIHPQPAPTTTRHPLREEGTYYYAIGFVRAPPIVPGSEISQPPPYPPTAAPTSSAPSHPSPKRKREDGGDTLGDEGSGKKHVRWASTDD